MPIPVQSNFETLAIVVSAAGSTETIDWNFPVYRITLDQNCTFSFSNLPSNNVWKEIYVYVSGAFTLTLPAACDWGDATPVAYGSPTLYWFGCIDGTNVLTAVGGKSFG